MPSTLSVSLRSLSFPTLDLWWAAGSEDQFSTSPWSIREKPKWSSHHPCPEPCWTAWLSRAWCAAVGKVFCLCLPEGRWWRPFLCKAPIAPAKASPSSCNAEHQFLEDFEVLWSNWSLFDIITQNYRTWILLVIKIIISNQNNYSTWHFTPTNFF